MRSCGVGEELLLVRQKPLGLLHYLIEHAGQLVSKEELRQSVWASTYVSPGAGQRFISAICVPSWAMMQSVRSSSKPSAVRAIDSSVR